MSTTLPPMQVITSCGLDLAPDAHRWFDAPDAADLAAIDGLDAPVLDVGCGPGRIVSHLTAQGTAALGVDVSVEAVDRTRALGAPVLHRSVFDPLPGEGRWGAAVLLDGNIGIGGAPDTLLRRLHDLLRPGGRVVVEVEAPGVVTRVVDARITLDGVSSDWFPWAIVSVACIDDLGAAAGLPRVSARCVDGRWFATLQRA